MSQPDPTAFPLREFPGFEIERGDGRGAASVELDDRHINPNAVAHGAVAFTLMDTVMGAAVMSAVPAGSSCATIEKASQSSRRRQPDESQY